jgi:hypothetical protein
VSRFMSRRAAAKISEPLKTFGFLCDELRHGKGGGRNRRK